jgi:hypothetical protein
LKTAESFFKWAFDTRGNTVNKLNQGEEIPPEKFFLSFCSHTPTFVSNGPAGLNAAVKGIGFVPKEEYLEEILAIYMEHINSFDPADQKAYSQRGLAILARELYAPDVKHRIDFARLTSLELVKLHSYENYKANPECTLCYYQPPAISYELRGKMRILDENDSGKREIYQQFVNAQHDVYHAPNVERWPTRPAYVFEIEEVYDNGVSKEGFGKKLLFPY